MRSHGLPSPFPDAAVHMGCPYNGPGQEVAVSKRTTMADVAAHLGVSVATVSMALSDRPDSRIPEETKERVRTAAAELGYAPNAAARSLRTGRSRSIGFISDEVMITRFASAMIRGVLDVADERGHAVLMAETDRRPDRLVRAVDALSAQRIDGLVLGLMHARRITVPELGDLPPTCSSTAPRRDGRASSPTSSRRGQPLRTTSSSVATGASPSSAVPGCTWSLPHPRPLHAAWQASTHAWPHPD